MTENISCLGGGKKRRPTDETVNTKGNDVGNHDLKIYLIMDEKEEAQEVDRLLSLHNNT